MQVGDLVTLSAAGKKNKGNDLVVGKVGVIIEISEPSQSKYPINIRWFNISHSLLRHTRDTLRVKRYEIKKV